MIKKIYLNKSLRSLPVGALFRYGGVFFWRGVALRGCGFVRVYTEQSMALRSQLIFRNDIVVQYYKEY